MEIAKALGVKVIARAGRDKHAIVKARGADAVLDSALPFKDEVLRISGGGVQAVTETLGGVVFDESLRCLADGGTLVTIGYAWPTCGHAALSAVSFCCRRFSRATIRLAHDFYRRGVRML